MKAKYFIYKVWCAAFVLLAVLLQGCSRDSDMLASEDDDADNKGVMMISTRATGDDAEAAIRTLHLFVFEMNADGTENRKILDKLYYTSNAVEGTAPTDFKSFFVKENGAYKIAEILKKSPVKVLLVANELTDMGSSLSTVNDVKSFLFNFDDVYGDNGMNIIINATDRQSNKGYIPMYAESGIVYPNDWERVLELALERMLAKVTVKVSVKQDGLTVNSASIVRVPEWGTIGSYTYAGNRLPSTKIQTFQGAVTSTSGTSDVLTFYVPEYILSDDSWAKELYSYIQLNAKYTAGGSDIVSTFKVPLGDGINKFYTDDTPKGIDDFPGTLTKEDLKVSRNKNYDYDITVSSVGTLAVMQVTVTIAGWNSEIQNVDGNINPPSLTLSSIDWVYKTDGTKNRIYFWTNIATYKILPKVSVSADGINRTEVNTEDVFIGISGSDRSNILSFVDSGLDYPYNGYFDLVIKDTYKTGYIINLTFDAGGLKRTIKVTTPQP